MNELITDNFREELTKYFTEKSPLLGIDVEVLENNGVNVNVAYQPKHATAYDLVELQAMTRLLEDRFDKNHEQGMIRFENGWISLAKENSTRNRFSDVDVSGEHVELPEMYGQVGTKSNYRLALRVVVSPCQEREFSLGKLQTSTYENIMKDRLLKEADELVRQAAFNPLRVRHELPEVQPSDLEAYIERNQRI